MKETTGKVQLAMVATVAAIMTAACTSSSAAHPQRSVRPAEGSSSTPAHGSAQVGTAASCTRNDLRLDFNQEGASQSIVSEYKFTNVANTACRIDGFPRFVLRTAHDGIIANVKYSDTSKPEQLLVHTGSSVTASTQTFAHLNSRAKFHATTERIYLPGISEPFTQDLPRGGLPLSHTRLSIDVSPLTAQQN